jgi:DNA-binding MarR family transcriptional regulator
LSAKNLSRTEYEELAEFRYQIRRFLHFSETAARDIGIEPQQHQALLAIKGMPKGHVPTIGYLAGRLLLKHQSAVGLVDRLERLRLVTRRAGSKDARQVLIELTAEGEEILRRLSLAHREELEHTAPELASALRAILRRTAQLRTA